VTFRLRGTGDRSVSLMLGEGKRTFNTQAYLTPHGRGFGDSIQVDVRNLMKGTVLRYTTDGSNPTASAAVCTGPLTFTRTTTLKARAFSDDGTIFTPVTATYTRQPPRPSRPAPESR
jgi:hypothetical protein